MALGFIKTESSPTPSLLDNPDPRDTDPFNANRGRFNLNCYPTSDFHHYYLPYSNDFSSKLDCNQKYTTNNDCIHPQDKDVAEYQKKPLDYFHRDINDNRPCNDNYTKGSGLTWTTTLERDFSPTGEIKHSSSLNQAPGGVPPGTETQEFGSRSDIYPNNIRNPVPDIITELHHHPAHHQYSSYHKLHHQQRLTSASAFSTAGCSPLSGGCKSAHLDKDHSNILSDINPTTSTTSKVPPQLPASMSYGMFSHQATGGMSAMGGVHAAPPTYHHGGHHDSQALFHSGAAPVYVPTTRAQLPASVTGYMTTTTPPNGAAPNGVVGSAQNASSPAGVWGMSSASPGVGAGGGGGTGGGDLASSSCYSSVSNSQAALSSRFGFPPTPSPPGGLQSPTARSETSFSPPLGRPSTLSPYSAYAVGPPDMWPNGSYQGVGGFTGQQAQRRPGASFGDYCKYWLHFIPNL